MQKRIGKAIMKKYAEPFEMIALENQRKTELLNNMKLVAGEVKDLMTQLKNIWDKLTNKLEEHKFNIAKAEGIFVHDREKLDKDMKALMKQVETRVTEDCKRYRENIEAGKGSVEASFGQLYAQGEPLQKTQDQVSTQSTLD